MKLILHGTLTPVEQEILSLLVRGYTQRAVSEKLSQTTTMIAEHLRHAKERMECSTTVQLAVEFALAKKEAKNEQPTVTD